jgi:hypothetical protein
VDAMMVEELGISPDQENLQPLREGLLSFFSFMLFSILPVLPFIVVAIGSISCGRDLYSTGISSASSFFCFREC